MHQAVAARIPQDRDGTEHVAAWVETQSVNAGSPVGEVLQSGAIGSNSKDTGSGTVVQARAVAILQVVVFSLVAAAEVNEPIRSEEAALHARSVSPRFKTSNDDISLVGHT